MIATIRVLVALARPSVVVLMTFFAATGLVQGGAVTGGRLFAPVLVTVVAFLVFAVTLNDVADEAIDRVNLAGDRGRPVVVGGAARSTFLTIAATSAVVALVAGVTVHPLAGAVVSAGLALAAAYSLRPVRLADRGAVASMLLPLGYVAVPYLVGLLGAKGAVAGRDVALLAGLYVGFIGRILLKDFRDVRGDALFGKRTFLVRHGRRATCAASAGCWVLGLATIVAVRDADAAFVAVQLAHVGGALLLLRSLARAGSAGGGRRDEWRISAIAILGRGMVASLVGHLSMVHAGWATVPRVAAVLAIGTFSLHAAAVMAHRGPRPGRTTVPASWSAGAGAGAAGAVGRGRTAIA